MNPETIFTLLSGGGLTGVFLAIIAWARGSKKDHVEVASEWAALTKGTLQTAKEDIDSLRGELTALRADLELARATIRQMSHIAVDAIEELERHDQARGEMYRNRLRSIS